MGSLYTPSLLVIIAQCFTCGQNKKIVKHQRVSKYYENGFLQKFSLRFMSLLTARFVENSHI